MSKPSFAEQLRHQRVGLALSAGFFGFYHQAGVLEAVVELGIRPVAVAGNSAGALVAALFAAGLPPGDIKQALCRLRRRDFWDAGWPFSRRGFGILAGERFKAELGRVLPCHGFEACEIPLTVGVFDAAVGRVRHISSGALIPAVYASSALPYLFQPQEIDGKVYWDGGFYEKTPLVPFLSPPEVEVVLVSYLPQRDSRERVGLSFLPGSMPFFSDIPFEERLERDRTALRLLRGAKKRVVVIAPRHLKLGPFSLDRAEAAYDNGYRGARDILSSNDGGLLGAPDLGR
jgi:predicted acylesterase/phospholipase RssA